MTEQAKPPAAELAEWARLMAKTTPEPWRLGTYNVWQQDTGRWICDTDELRKRGLRHDGPAEGEDDANAEFIAAARTAMPRLLAEVARLRTLLRECAEQIGPPSAYQQDQTGERAGGYEVAVKLQEELGLKDD